MGNNIIRSLHVFFLIWTELLDVKSRPSWDCLICFLVLLLHTCERGSASLTCKWLRDLIVLPVSLFLMLLLNPLLRHKLKPPCRIVNILRAYKSDDWRFWTIEKSSINGFPGLEIVKCSARVYLLSWTRQRIYVRNIITVAISGLLYIPMLHSCPIARSKL